MSRGSFNIRSNSQDFRVNIDEISGSGGADSPIISIPIKVDYCPLRTSYENGSYEVISLKAELKATDKNFKIAETTLQTSFRISHKTDRSHTFNFLINESIITRIEKYRKGNLPFYISISLQVGILQTANYRNQKGEDDDRLFVTGFEIGHGNVSFTVEQSQWVNRILPHLGHNSYKLIEIPATNQIIPDEYKQSLAEFEEARKYFTNGDYDKSVGHCRAALDPFKRKLPNLKQFVRSKSEFEWADAILESTEMWLEKVIKETFILTSKTHHAPSIGHFSRNEAEIVLIITTGIIAYVGKIEYKLE